MTFKIVFVISLLVFGLTANLYLLLSPTYVNWQYSRLGENGQVARPAQKADALAIVAYLRGRTERLPIMGLRERRHLADVRAVFALGFLAFKASLFLAIVALLGVARRETQPKTPRIFRFVALSAIAGVSALLVAFSAMLANFNWAFERFHRLFFAGDSWLFGPDSLLIRLFPLQFWMRAGLHWALLTMGTLFVISLAATVAARLSQTPG